MRALIPTPAGPRLAALERQAADRDRELADLKTELQALQTRYLSEIGHLYAELARLEDAIAAAEIAAGVRPPLVEKDDVQGDAAGTTAGAREPGSCGNRGAPSDDLKRVFRQVARSVHPDLALTGAARYRRHSLMAEANRAYAERDEDRLRLILRAWDADPEAVIGDDPEADRRRIDRRIVALEAHLLAIDAEIADLRTSAIWRLKTRIDEATAQGWDLFAEMIREATRTVRGAQARLIKAQICTGDTEARRH